MKQLPIFQLVLVLASAIAPLQAGTLIVTALPGDEAVPQLLRTLDGQPLGSTATVQLGAFPGLSDDQILDLATQGYASLSASWLPFGATREMGSGAGNQSGSFEIAAQQEIPESGSALAGQEISIIIKNGAEFLVARFKGKTFAAGTETGLEQVAVLQLRDAKLIVGNRLGPQAIATASTPAVGSYNSWMASFAGITDEALRMPDADPDHDGISNFMEYATGGDPSDASDTGVCRIFTDESSHLWLGVRRQAGLGWIDHEIQASSDVSTWSPFSAELQWDPAPPDAKSWLRVRVPDTMGPAGFFRVEVNDAP